MQSRTLVEYRDVPLASGNPLTRVVTPRPPFSVVFTDWLSMIAALGVASRPATSGSTTRSCPKVAGHGASVARDAAAQHVQDAVDHLTQVCGSGMASGGVGWQQGSQFVPLGIGQIAGVTFSTHAPSVTTIPSSPQELPAHV